MHEFYTSVLGLKDIPLENFPRPSETKEKGYSGEIKFATDGIMQMHLARRTLMLPISIKTTSTQLKEVI
jgi:hypothetical protein